MTWKGEKSRHSLASRGINTKDKKFSKFPYHLDKTTYKDNMTIEEEERFRNAIREYLEYYPIPGFEFTGVGDLSGTWWWNTPDNDYALVSTPFYNEDNTLPIDLLGNDDYINIDDLELEPNTLTPRVYVELIRHILQENVHTMNEYFEKPISFDAPPGFEIAKIEMLKRQKKDAPCILCGKGFKREWMEGNKRVLLFDGKEDAQSMINQLQGSNKQWRGGYVGGGYTLEIIEER